MPSKEYELLIFLAADYGPFNPLMVKSSIPAKDLISRMKNVSDDDDDNKSPWSAGGEDPDKSEFIKIGESGIIDVGNIIAIFDANSVMNTSQGHGLREIFQMACRQGKE